MTQITEEIAYGASFKASRMFAPLVAVALLLLLAPAAQAAPPTGSPVATITIGKKGAGLRAGSVRVTTTGNAKIFGSWAGMPVSDVSVGANSRASMVLSGSIKLRKGKRSATLRGLLVKFDHRSIRITGKISARRITIFTAQASSQPKLNAPLNLVDASASNLALTKGAAREIHRKIKSFSVRSRRLGVFKAAAWETAPAPANPGTLDPSTSGTCKPIAETSTDPARPGTAIDLTCASLVWHLRDSWIHHAGQSIAIAPAQGLLPIKGGDHVCPDAGASKETTYSFWFPVLSGWWDPASGQGNLRSTGGERSRIDYGSVIADIELHDVELKLAGAGAELWANVHSRSTDKPESDQRVKFATFNAATPMTGGPIAPGTALSRARVTLTPDGSTAFNGFYEAGMGFGCIDVGFNF